MFKAGRSQCQGQVINNQSTNYEAFIYTFVAVEIQSSHSMHPFSAPCYSSKWRFRQEMVHIFMRTTFTDFTHSVPLYVEISLSNVLAKSPHLFMRTTFPGIDRHLHKSHKDATSPTRQFKNGNLQTPKFEPATFECRQRLHEEQLLASVYPFADLFSTFKNSLYYDIQFREGPN